MAKLFFRYGPMNSGKSTALLQVAHNYHERGQSVLVAKPCIDKKGGDRVISRLGVDRAVDILLAPDHSLLEQVLQRTTNSATTTACLLIDEAQFLSPAQVDDALNLAVFHDLPVIAYGLRTDFLTRAFPGSARLLEIAHQLEELKTICRCGKKAMFNARIGSEGILRKGEQVAIDGLAANYEALCAACYLNTAPTN